MDRVVVIGTSGSGKSTFARTLAESFDLPLVELDAIHWMPGWEERPTEHFLEMVDAATSGERWVVDGNYSKARDVVWPRADTVIWLDYPRRVVMGRIVRRTLFRMITREALWNGNRERLSNLFSRDPMKNIVIWSWTTYERRRLEYSSIVDEPAWAHLDLIRVGSPREAGALIRKLQGV